MFSNFHVPFRILLYLSKRESSVCILETVTTVPAFLLHNRHKSFGEMNGSTHVIRQMNLISHEVVVDGSPCLLFSLL